MLVCTYGGGTNSTALLLGCIEKDIRPEVIIFSDTGGEKPHTYEYLAMFSKYLVSKGFPEITITYAVDREGNRKYLEKFCLDKKKLPAIAYGFKTCSMRYKVDPVEKFFNNHPGCIEAWKRGEKVTKMIGFDAGELRRAKDFDDKWYTIKYPLIEWKWYREDCIKAIERAGLPLPGKSACFFCPSSRKPEILELKEQYPELLDRALAMEDNAKDGLTSVKGLGRRFAWRDFVSLDSLTNPVEEAPEIPCGCYDGDSSDD